MMAAPSRAAPALDALPRLCDPLTQLGCGGSSRPTMSALLCSQFASLRVAPKAFSSVSSNRGQMLAGEWRGGPGGGACSAAERASSAQQRPSLPASRGTHMCTCRRPRAAHCAVEGASHCSRPCSPCLAAAGPSAEPGWCFSCMTHGCARIGRAALGTAASPLPATPLPPCSAASAAQRGGGGLHRGGQAELPQAAADCGEGAGRSLTIAGWRGRHELHALVRSQKRHLWCCAPAQSPWLPASRCRPAWPTRAARARLRPA